MATSTWNRGRTAESPKDIPVKGLLDTLKRVKNGIKVDKISMMSAAMAYYALFALVPALTSFIVIYAWIYGPVDISQHIDKVSHLLPHEAQLILRNQLQSLASNAPSTLGLSAIGALLFSLWSASKGSKALMESLNVIYNEKEDRGFFKTNGVALFLTFLATVLGIVALAVVVGVPAFLSQFKLAEQLGFLFKIGVTVGSWIFLLGLFSFFLSFAYRVCPNRQNAKWRWVSWGAVLASILWALASALFSWYAAEFANFNKTYGSLGAVIGLMMWFYISSFVVLLGGEVNAELEHQTVKDSTTGQRRPLGQRGAKMADTIGKKFLFKKRNGIISKIFRKKFHEK